MLEPAGNCLLTSIIRKNLTKNVYGENHRSLKFSVEPFSSIMEVIKARTTCQVGVGLAGWFWQRLVWVGSGKE